MSPDGPVQGITLRDLRRTTRSVTVGHRRAGRVLGAMCGQVGALMANEAIKLITGAGDPPFGRGVHRHDDGARRRSAAVPEEFA